MKKSVPKQKAQKYLYFYIPVMVILLLVIIFQIVFPKEESFKRTKTAVFPAQWKLVGADGTAEQIKIPGKYEVESGTPMVIETTIPNTVADNIFGCFRASQQNIYIYVNGVVRHVYDTKDTRILDRNSPSAFVMWEFYKEDAGKTLRIELTSFTSFSGTINEIRWGTHFDLWYDLIKANILELVFVAFMFILSIVIIIASRILRKNFNMERSLEFLGWITLFSTLVTVSESQVRQLFARNLSAFSDCTYYFCPLLLLSIILFLNEIQQHRYSKRYTYLCILTLCSIPIFPLLSFLNIMELFTSIWVLVILVAIVLIVLILSLIQDLKSGEIEDYTGICMSLIFFVVISVLGHVVVNILDVMDSVGIFFLVGLLSLLWATLLRTIRNVQNISRDRAKAIYEREAKDRLFANISHELRTPLNSVLVTNEMIKRDSNDPAIRTYAETIEYSGNMLLGLINDVLDFSKAESGKLRINPVEFFTSDLISDSIRMIDESVTKKGLELKKDIDETLPKKFFGDDIRIRQIIINLLSNAVKYTKKGSITYVVTGKKADEKTFNLTISVTDTGQGIKPENIDHLFESFTRFDEGKNKYIEGTGLGLSITKQLVELMGGTVDVTSTYGSGSTFHVIIPVKIIDAAPMGTLESAVETTHHKSETYSLKAPGTKILAVDDSTINLAVLKGLLRDTEIEVTTAISGMECIQKCHDTKFDLILMDHMMPEMDGIETLHKLRAGTEDLNSFTPVAILTANAYGDVREQYLSEGFIDYISKPIDMNRLFKTLSQLIQGSVLTVEETE